MASSKEDSTTAAAKQLGSMSLDRSAERNDENTRPIAKSGTPTKMCSVCEKKSDTLKKCRNCKCVWYCDKKCQRKHWKEHTHECKRIQKELDNRGGKSDVGTEKEVGPLGKVPPREECSICMRMLPIHESLHSYFPCCGKIICCGCDHQHSMKSGKERTCAFCREPMPRSDEEYLARLVKRVERKDPHALLNMAIFHGEGELGLPVDHAKCVDLLRESAGLGCPCAQYNLGNFRDDGEMGLEQDEEEALKYWEEAAEGGDIFSLHNLGCVEEGFGDHVAAMRHWRLSACGGMRRSMGALIDCFEDGLLRHGDLAETLQVFYRARAELKSDDRDQYIKHLKKTGEYKEHHDY